MKFMKLFFVLLFAVSLTVACDNGGDKKTEGGDDTEQKDTTAKGDNHEGHDHDHEGHDH